MGLQLKTKKWLDRLIKLPESGMGYQFVNITLKDGRVIHNVAVINGEEIVSKLPARESEIAKIEMSN